MRTDLNSILSIKEIQEGILGQLGIVAKYSIQEMLDKAIVLSKTNDEVSSSVDGFTLECNCYYCLELDKNLIEARLFDIDGAMMEAYLEVINSDDTLSEEAYDDVWSIGDWVKSDYSNESYEPKLLTTILTRDNKDTLCTFPAGTFKELKRLKKALEGKASSEIFIDDRGESWFGHEFAGYKSEKNKPYGIESCFCLTTDCILSGGKEFKDDAFVFADLRFDTENNQFDMNFGTIGEDGFSKNSEWSDSTNISFCPYCGRRLPKVL